MTDARFARYPSLAGKTVFISGGSSGIGASFVQHFAEQGAAVAFVGRNEAGAADVIAACAGAARTPVFRRCDVTDIGALKAALAGFAAELGPVQILVNSAANDERHKTGEVTPQFWDEMIAVNLKHYFFATQAAAPAMRAAGAGAIINIGSIAWMLKVPDYPVYAAANAAIVGLTRAHAAEFGPDGVRVNCVSPGWTMTRKQVEQWLTPEGEAAIERGQLIKDRLYPPDVARLALFLASDDARMITAQNYVVDGGWA